MLMASNCALPRLDVYGDALASATTFQGEWSHDPTIAMLWYFAKDFACTSAKTEDAAIFGSVLRTSLVRTRLPLAAERTRAATVDLRGNLTLGGTLVETSLVECTTVHYGVTHCGGGAPPRNAAVSAWPAFLLSNGRRSQACSDGLWHSAWAWWPD